MSASVSIFDIPLIIDSISQNLPLHQIQVCRRVNKLWSSLFKPHLWSTTKLLVSTTLTDDKIDSLIRNKPYIRSLTIDANHIEKISTLCFFTTLQELVLVDDNYGCFNMVDSVHFIAMIDNNPHLQSLEINLHQYRYWTKELSPALLLAIIRHPSLIKLKWQVPHGHGGEVFAQCLLYACHQSIQELHIGLRLVAMPKRFHDLNDKCWCSVNCYGHCPLAYEDFAPFQATPGLNALRHYFGYPMDQLGAPFALRRIHLVHPEYATLYLDLIRSSPELQHVAVDFGTSESAKLMDLLITHPAVREIDMSTTIFYLKDFPSQIRRFTQLQRLCLPELNLIQWQQTVLALIESSLESLEVLGLDQKSITASDVVSLLNTFPNLRELDFESVRIYAQGESVLNQNQVSCVQSLGDLYSLDTVVSDWEPMQHVRPDGNMGDWWKHWSRAQSFMRAVREEYLHQGGKKKGRISMRFMLPIQAFMSPKDLEDYRKLIHGRGFTLTDAYCMAHSSPTEEDDLAEEGWDDEMVKETIEDVWDENDGDWNEFRQAQGTELEREYSIAKSRNRHHSLNSKKRSAFQRPFKK